jgi:hypothetical protein
MKRYLPVVLAALLLVACEESTKNCEVHGPRDSMILIAYQAPDGSNVEGTVPTDGNGTATVGGVPNSVDCGTIQTKELPMFLD